MKNFSKNIALIVSLIIFLSLVAIFFFLYRQINKNSQQAESDTMELENEIIQRNEIKLLNSSIGTIKENRDLLKTHFAESSDIVPFLNVIESLAPKARVKAETTSVDIAKDSSILMVKINTSGSFENIYKFLILLENSPYALEISEVDMKKEGEIETTTPKGLPASTPSPKWQANFEVKLLSFIK